jgi:hypothetical protein
METPKCKKGQYNAKRFVDENGNIFEKGKFVGNENGETPPIETESKESDVIVQKAPLELKKSSEFASMTLMMKQMQESFNEKLKELETQVQENKNASDFKVVGKNEDNVDLIEYDEKDYLPEPKKYYTIDRGYYMPVYQTLDGRKKYAPQGIKVYFGYEGSDIKQVGKDTDYVTISVFETYSKRAAKYIEESPYYNISIFNSWDKASDVKEKGMVSKMADALSRLNRLTSRELQAEALRYGIDVSNDPSVEKIKEKVLDFILEDMRRKDKNQNDERNKRMTSETILFKGENPHNQ